MDRAAHIKGLLYGGLAYTVWGLLPLYWKLVNVVSAYQVFAHRIVWSFLFLMVILAYKKQIPTLLEVIKKKEYLLNAMLCTVFISLNWFVYIWGVNNGYVIEASLGYFINPLVLTAFGALFFKEKLNGLQWAGVILATIGVLYLTVMYKQVPIIAIVLAISFALYGVFKKKSKLNSLMGLSFETAILVVPVLLYILFSESKGQGFIGNTPMIYWFFIMLSGLATATPLLLYSEATKRLPLGTVGFLQYISPTISLALGVFVFKEDFDKTKLFAFILIWLALVFYSIAQYRLLKTESRPS